MWVSSRCRSVGGPAGAPLRGGSGSSGAWPLPCRSELGCRAHGVNAGHPLPVELSVGDGDICGVELARPDPGEFDSAVALTGGQQFPQRYSADERTRTPQELW